jgi:hypothetical protein
MTEYAKDSKDAGKLFDFALEIYDRSWDEKTNFCSLPDFIYTEPEKMFSLHATRDTIGYVIGLLTKKRPGDIERAHLAIKTIIDNQFRKEGAVYNGCFRTFLEKPDPPDNAVDWKDYDPNWREFIAVNFLAILINFSDLLDSDTIKKIDEAMFIACEGSYRRSITNEPGMADNIVLMHLPILDFYGRRYNKPEWVEHSERNTEVFYRKFMKNKSLEEFNSPTYYGICMDGLTLLRKYSGSPETRKYADEILTELWRDISEFYHPGLKNMCGPYLRAYGIDMRTYVAVMGSLIFQSVGEEAAPASKLILPGAGPKDFDIGHFHDIYNVFLSITIGNQIPAEFVPSLIHFKGPHGIQKTVPTPNPQIATAYLDNNYMMGALYGVSKLYWQLHPFIIHWKNQDRINTMRIVLADSNGILLNSRSTINIDAVVNQNKASISARRISHDDTVNLYFEIKCGSAEAVVVKEGLIEADGIRIKVESACVLPKSIHPEQGTALVPLQFNSLPSGMEEMLINLEIIAG